MKNLNVIPLLVGLAAIVVVLVAVVTHYPGSIVMDGGLAGFHIAINGSPKVEASPIMPASTRTSEERVNRGG
jgi:hypothetical protein